MNSTMFFFILLAVKHFEKLSKNNGFGFIF